MPRNRSPRPRLRATGLCATLVLIAVSPYSATARAQTEAAIQTEAAVQAEPAARGEAASQIRPAADAPQPPRAERQPRTTQRHGVTLVDPYAWLRDRDDPRTLAYLEAENAYTEARTAHLDALEEELFAEMKGRIRETDLSVPTPHGGWLYYTRTEEGKQYPIYARKRSEDAPEQVLLDVNALAEGHDFFRLGAYTVSPDHRLVAWSFDTVGDEDYTLRVKDLESGEMLADSIPNTTYGVAWGNDAATLFYTTRDAAKRPDKVWRHRLGDEPAEDEVVLHETDEAFFAGVERTRDGEYVLVGSSSATTTEAWFLDADEPGGEPTLLLPREHEVEYSVGHHGGHVYLVTNHGGADNFQLLRAPMAGYPAGSAATAGETGSPWEVVIAPRETVKLEAVDLFRDFMVVREREVGVRRLRVMPLGAGETGAGETGEGSRIAEHLVELPETVYTVWPSGNPEFDTDAYRFQYTSMTTPKTVYDYRPAARELELLKRDEVLGGYDPADYTTLRLYARAADGVAVPVNLVHRRGVELDGDNPTLLYAYGSYGSNMDPWFSSNVVSLLDRGFVFAVAQVRGGGELGEAWHEQGRMLEKRNTFTDFVAVAEFLVATGYTRPGRLAIQGGSAGGLLVGAVVNLRPELFAAVLAKVPFVDVMNTMLDPTIPLTVIEYEEWGNPNEEEYFRYMLSYSPYDNVRRADYPAMLITAGLNDTRVGYWEPAKWTARLRTMDAGAGADDEPILLKVNLGAGHGGASGRYDALRETAFEYAFLIDRVAGTKEAADGATEEALDEALDERAPAAGGRR